MSLFHEKNATAQRSQPENLQKHAAGAKEFFIILWIFYKRYCQISGPNASYQIRKKKNINVSSHFQNIFHIISAIFFPTTKYRTYNRKKTKTKEP